MRLSTKNSFCSYRGSKNLGETEVITGTCVSAELGSFQMITPFIVMLVSPFYPLQTEAQVMGGNSLELESDRVCVHAPFGTAQVSVPQAALPFAEPSRIDPLLSC